jgi:hypothetical protein
MQATKYTMDDGSSACFISNSHDNEDVNVTFEGSTYHVPAWSVSILPDCKTVAYNTAKVVSSTIHNIVTFIKQSTKCNVVVIGTDFLHGTMTRRSG